jgi:hypothetical protein
MNRSNDSFVRTFVNENIPKLIEAVQQYREDSIVNKFFVLRIPVFLSNFIPYHSSHKDAKDSN